MTKSVCKYIYQFCSRFGGSPAKYMQETHPVLAEMDRMMYAEFEKEMVEFELSMALGKKAKV